MREDDDLEVDVVDDTDDDADEPAAEVLDDIRALADELTGHLDQLGDDERAEALERLAAVRDVLSAQADGIRKQAGGAEAAPTKMSRGAVQAVLNGQHGRRA